VVFTLCSAEGMFGQASEPRLCGTLTSHSLDAATGRLFSSSESSLLTASPKESFLLQLSPLNKRGRHQWAGGRSYAAPFAGIGRHSGRPVFFCSLFRDFKTAGPRFSQMLEQLVLVRLDEGSARQIEARL